MANNRIGVMVGSALKSLVSIGDFDQWMDAQIQQALGGGQGGIEEAYNEVAWMNRGVTLIAESVSSLPFIIKNSAGDEIDSSKDYGNVLGFLPNLEHLLLLMTASVVLLGRAYLRVTQNRLQADITVKF